MPRTALPRFLVLYAAIYAAFGVKSPYLPALLADHGLEPEAIGLVLAAGTAVRLAAGPAAGRLADRLDAARMVLAGSAAGGAVVVLGYLPAYGLWPLFLIGVIHAAMLAPIAPLADTLALATAAPARLGGWTGRGFDYGWLRGAGSAAFILGSVLSGQAIARLGIGVIVGLNAALLAVTALGAARAPKLPPRPMPLAVPARHERGGIGALLRLKLFRRVLLAAALILGSHAMHDGFAVIRWGAAGIGPDVAGLLWSEQVAAEVLVFLFLGRRLLEWLGTAGAAVLAAAAGVVRWAVMAQTVWVPAIAMIEPLHGLSFALLHLACMRLLAEIVPPRLAATALTLYGTVAIGAATALLTLASGPLYARLGAQGFWAMAALCAMALPIAWTLREPSAPAAAD